MHFGYKPLDQSVILGPSTEPSTESIWWAFPVIGAVLAIVGMVARVLLEFLHVNKPEEPLLKDVEKYLKDISHPLIDKTKTPPAVSLTYDILTTNPNTTKRPFSKLRRPENHQRHHTQSKRPPPPDVGDDDACLFASPLVFTSVSDPSTPRPMASGTVGVAPKDTVTGLLVPSNRTATLESYNFSASGPNVADTTLRSGNPILKTRQSCTMSWQGFVNKVGSTTWQFLESLAWGDKYRMLIDLQRI